MNLNNSGQQTGFSRKKTFYNMERRQKWWAARAKPSIGVTMGPKSQAGQKFCSIFHVVYAKWWAHTVKTRPQIFQVWQSSGCRSLQACQLLIAEHFRKETNIITRYIWYPLSGVFFPVNLSSILTACFSIQKKSSKPQCVSAQASPSAGAFAAQINAVLIPVLLLSPRQHRFLCSCSWLPSPGWNSQLATSFTHSFTTILWLLCSMFVLATVCVFLLPNYLLAQVLPQLIILP